LAREFDPALEPKYNKFYIGLAKDGQPNNFVVSRPRKNTMMFTVRLPQSAEMQSKLEASGFEFVDFDRRQGGYRLRLGMDDLKARGDALREIVGMAYRNRAG
jgi:hypothetical protein